MSSQNQKPSTSFLKAPETGARLAARVIAVMGATQRARQEGAKQEDRFALIGAAALWLRRVGSATAGLRGVRAHD